MSLFGVALFLAGLALLIVGAELVIRGAARLALSAGVKPLVLGITVVAVGTSAPELAIGITASLQGSGALAVGNIAGTNLFNVLFILGLSAVVKPLPMHLETLKLVLPAGIIAALAMLVMGWDGVLSRLDGALFVGAAVLYTIFLVFSGRREALSVKGEFQEVYGANDLFTRYFGGRVWVTNTALLAAGLAVSVWGAHWLVIGAVDIARTVGMSEALIGLTIVAVGTSAPELVTTVVATLHDDRDVAVGNILGSSTYNILAILGLTCLLTPNGVPVDRELIVIDVPLMLAVAVLCVPVFITGRSVSRTEGALFVTMYFVYFGWLLTTRQ